MMFEMKTSKSVTLIEVMIAMSILAVAFFPIMTYFSNRARWTREVRVRNSAIAIAKNSLDFLVEDTPFSTLRFNQVVPDFDSANPDKNGLVCNDKKNQIFAVLGGSYKSSNSSIPAGGLSGQLVRPDDKVTFQIKLLATPFIDSSSSITPGGEIVFKTTNWDRNALKWPPSQAKDYHVLPGSKTYVDLFRSGSIAKTKSWDGRRLNPQPNSQGLIIPFAKVSVRVRWKFGNKERTIEFESYKANIM